ncbi:hypothetical protein LCGC14_0769030 [marine sediment metagenome]|uniref:Glycosyltransferase 2-like domain-containing protein n=1 Tax=marine sediment metagenome TaxID=412755 RepID=A0A0F9T5S5_9ZZZZ
MNDNVIVYVSSRNNYRMLAGEVLNFDFGGFEFINVDDGSCKKERRRGSHLCHDREIVFLKNKQRGVQWSTQTLIDFINENRPQCKWIICFQHDNYPLSDNLFGRVGSLIKQGFLDDFGALGFNIIDSGRYSKDSYKEWQLGQEPLAMLGLAHLSILHANKRLLCPVKNDLANHHYNEWKNPFIIEIPFWSVAGINVQQWNKCIEPTTNYQFHLWFPDIMMQFNKYNCPCVILPRLYCMNNQRLKKKYGIPVNSAHAARKGDKYHFGEYGPHLKYFKKRWKWDYEKVKTFHKVKELYQGTLLAEYFEHDIQKGPLKSYDFGEY